MQGERLAGGLWCREVLALLSDYLDGELAAQEKNRVEAHLKVCDVCERFGGDFSHIVKSIRLALQSPPPLGPDQVERLRKPVLDSD